MSGKREILQEIKRIEDFTCSYWYPAYENAEKKIMDTPTAPAIIWDIIKNRSAYVKRLRRVLKSA